MATNLGVTKHFHIHLGQEMLTIKALRATREGTLHWATLSNPCCKENGAMGRQVAGGQWGNINKLDGNRDLRFQGLSMEAERSPVTYSDIISSPYARQFSTPECSFHPILLISHHQA